MNLELYKAACKSSEFLLKHYPSAREWDNTVGWCAWYISHGFMVALHREEDDSIIALAAARPVNDPEDGNTPYKHAEDGPCVFIDFLAIDEPNPLIFPVFAIELRKRFGRREVVAFQRVKTFDYESFLRNTGKVNRIGELHEPAKTT